MSSAAGAGASSPVFSVAAAAAAAPASSVATAAASGVSAGSVFVKRSGDTRARFARVPILASDAVTDLAKRAALELNWRTTAAYVDLFLIKPAGGEHALATPTQAQIDAVLEKGKVLGEGMPLSLAGIYSGAWVVARLSPPPAGAPGECLRAAVLVRAGGPEGLAGAIPL